VVLHTYNPSTQEAEAGGSRVPGQPRLHNETLSTHRKRRREFWLSLGDTLPGQILEQLRAGCRSALLLTLPPPPFQGPLRPGLHRWKAQLPADRGSSWLIWGWCMTRCSPVCGGHWGLKEPTVWTIHQSAFQTAASQRSFFSTRTNTELRSSTL
jgi:hypothetical protein